MTGEVITTSVVMDGVQSHHFRPERSDDAGTDAIADEFARLALSGRGTRLRRMALRTLREWPGDYRGQVAVAAAAEPDARLRTEMESYPAFEEP